jgi:hypothetical protein
MADDRQVVPPGSPGELNEAELELVLLYVDGELRGEPEQLARAQALLATSPVARAVADDWSSAKVVLRERILEAPVKADLGLVRGRVMMKLPADAPASAVPSDEPRGVIAWLRGFGFGKVSLVAGMAAAAAIWIVASSTSRLSEEATQPADREVAVVFPSVANGDPSEPSVIIEDMEIESGTVMVSPTEQGGATIIWHFQPEEQGAG